jgi:predicted ArsR family transcriptional regulator
MKKLFEGQQEEIILTKEHLSAMISSDRSEVLWTFSPDVPNTVANVAKIIGKSPQTVHHHVKILVEKNLLVPTGTQKKRSRQETLYVWSFYDCRPQREGSSPEYRQQTAEIFAAVTRKMARENEKLQHAIADKQELALLSSLYNHHYNFSPDQLPAVRQVIKEAMKKLLELHESAKNGYRYHVVTFVSPTANAIDEMTTNSEEPTDT